MAGDSGNIEIVTREMARPKLVVGEKEQENKNLYPDTIETINAGEKGVIAMVDGAVFPVNYDPAKASGKQKEAAKLVADSMKQSVEGFTNTSDFHQAAEEIQQAFLKADEAIKAANNQNEPGENGMMASAAIARVVSVDVPHAEPVTQLIVGHVGIARVYIQRAGETEAECLTLDDMKGTEGLPDRYRRQIQEDMAENPQPGEGDNVELGFAKSLRVASNYIGMEGDCYPNITSIKVERGDRLMIPSAGVFLRSLPSDISTAMQTGDENKAAWQAVANVTYPPVQIKDAVPGSFAKAIVAEVKQDKQPTTFNVKPPRETGWPVRSN